MQEALKRASSGRGLSDVSAGAARAFIKKISHTALSPRRMFRRKDDHVSTASYVSDPSRNTSLGQVHRPKDDLSPMQIRTMKSLSQMIEFLEENHRREEGLYRKHGQPAEVKDLIIFVEQGKLPDLGIYSPHSLTSVIKYVMGSLYEPLIPYVISNEILVRMERMDKIEYDFIYEKFKHIRATNRELLKIFLLHLSHISSMIQCGMNTKALANAVGILLIRPSESPIELGMKEMTLKRQKIARLLIDNASSWPYDCATEMSLESLPDKQEEEVTQVHFVQVAWDQEDYDYTEEALRIMLGKFGAVENIGINREGNKAILSLPSLEDAEAVVAGAMEEFPQLKVRIRKQKKRNQYNSIENNSRINKLNSIESSAYAMESSSVENVEHNPQEDQREVNDDEKNRFLIQLERPTSPMLANLRMIQKSKDGIVVEDLEVESLDTEKPQTEEQANIDLSPAAEQPADLNPTFSQQTTSIKYTEDAQALPPEPKVLIGRFEEAQTENPLDDQDEAVVTSTSPLKVPGKQVLERRQNGEVVVRVKTHGCIDSSSTLDDAIPETLRSSDSVLISESYLSPSSEIDEVDMISSENLPSLTVTTTATERIPANQVVQIVEDFEEAIRNKHQLKEREKQQHEQQRKSHEARLQQRQHNTSTNRNTKSSSPPKSKQRQEASSPRSSKLQPTPNHTTRSFVAFTQTISEPLPKPKEMKNKKVGVHLDPFMTSDHVRYLKRQLLGMQKIVNTCANALHGNRSHEVEDAISQLHNSLGGILDETMNQMFPTSPPNSPKRERSLSSERLGEREIITSVKPTRQQSDELVEFLQTHSQTQINLLEAEVKAGQELLRLCKSQHEKEIAEIEKEMIVLRLSTSETEKISSELRRDLRKCRHELTCQIANAASIKREKATLDERVISLESKCQAKENELKKLTVEYEEMKKLTAETQIRLEKFRQQQQEQKATEEVLLLTNQNFKQTNNNNNGQSEETRHIDHIDSNIEHLRKMKMELRRNLQKQIDATKLALEEMSFGALENNEIQREEEELIELENQLRLARSETDEAMQVSRRKLDELLHPVFRHSVSPQNFSDKYEKNQEDDIYLQEIRETHNVSSNYSNVPAYEPKSEMYKRWTADREKNLQSLKNPQRNESGKTLAEAMRSMENFQRALASMHAN